MAWNTLFVFSIAAIPQCLAMTSNGRAGHGLIGYGISMYKPICPFACRAVLSSSSLNCSDAMAMDGEMMSDTSTACYANDDAFLKSLAFCIQYRCESELEAWQIETYWHKFEPGSQVGQQSPKWTYQETLSKISTAPTVTLVSGDPLNQTSTTSDDDYHQHHQTLSVFEKVEHNHEKYGLILLISGAVIPIAASLLRFIPFPNVLRSKFSATFINPPLFGSRHRVPYFNLAMMPARGQGIFIAYLLIVNIVLNAIGYHSAVPNTWYSNQHREILTYVSNRAGVLSFANVPLLVLYAGRNNILYWLTNWSQGTFLLLHRWVAYICTIQACLHSVIYLRIYVVDGEHGSESKLAYWIWGVIATLCMSILLPASAIPIRAKVYEMFLASHFVLALLALVGCYLHIFYRFEHQWGYEVWIYVAFATWGFDRLLRLLRLTQSGIQNARVTVIDEDYIRIDLDGVVGNGHAYLYFPTLTWRVWENHPFSITTSVVHQAEPHSSAPSQDIDDEIMVKDRKEAVVRSTSSRMSDAVGSEPTVGSSFYLRIQTGLTNMIRQHTTLPVLLESNYLPHQDMSSYRTLICIAGGVGVTAVIPLLRCHAGRAKLYWSSRSRGLVDSVEEMLQGIERTVLVGQRLDLREMIEEEAAAGKDDMAIVVSGPHRMADDARNIVNEVARKVNRSITLIEESFSW